jgi:hypothetical protein
MAPVVVVEGLGTEPGTPRKIVAALVGWVGQSPVHQRRLMVVAGLPDLLVVLVVLVALQPHIFLVVPVVVEDHRILPVLLVLVVLEDSQVVVAAAAVLVVVAPTAVLVAMAQMGMSSLSRSSKSCHAKTILVKP